MTSFARLLSLFTCLVAYALFAQSAQPSGLGGAAQNELPVASGQVLDVDGAPIIGALVTVVRYPGGLIMETPWLMHDSYSDKRRESGWSGTTSDIGAFSIQGASPGLITLRIQAPGYVSLGLYRRTLLNAAQTDFGACVLQRAVKVVGHVFSAGRPIAGAVVTSLPLGTGHDSIDQVSPLVVSDDEGNFVIDHLAPGPYRLQVKREGYLDVILAGHEAQAGAVVEGIEVELDHGLSILGRVQGLPEELPSDLAIHFDSYGGMASRAFPGSGRLGRDIPLEADGSFAIHGLVEGEKHLLELREGCSKAAWGTWGNIARSRFVIATAGDHAVRLKWFTPVQLEIKVVDAVTKQPVEVFKYAYSMENGTSGGSGESTFRSFRSAPAANPQLSSVGHSPLGTVRIEKIFAHVTPPVSAPPGMASVWGMWIDIQAPGYAHLSHREMMGTFRKDSQVTLELTPAQPTRILVRDKATGEPIAGASARLAFQRYAASDPRGAHHFDPSSLSYASSFDTEVVQTGDTGEAAMTTPWPPWWNARDVTESKLRRGRVIVTHPAYAPLAIEDVEFPKGAPLAIEVDMERGGTVFVKVTAADGREEPGASAHLYSQHARVLDPYGNMPTGSFARANEKGEVVFEHVATGLYYVSKTDSHIYRDKPEESGDLSPSDWYELRVEDGGVYEMESPASPRAMPRGQIAVNGRPLGNAHIELSPIDDDLGDTPYANRQRKVSGLTDGDGRFQLTTVVPGRYLLEVNHSARVMPFFASAELGAGSNELVFDLGLAEVSGQVLDVDVDGEPMPGVFLQVRLAAETPSVATYHPRDLRLFSWQGPTGDLQIGSGPNATMTDSEGRYTLSGVHPTQALVLQASKEGWVTFTGDQVLLDGASNLQLPSIELERAGSLTATFLASADGPRWAQLTVRAEYAGAQEGVASQSLKEMMRGTSKQAVQLSGLLPGTWRITGLATSFHDLSEWTEVVEVEIVAAQETKVVLKMDAIESPTSE